MVKKSKKADKPISKKEESFNNASKEAKSSVKAVEKYLKENNLDPTKDWSKDKKHGKKIRELLAISQSKSDKAKEKVEKLKESKKAGSTSKYDYPLVDGKEMTPEQKKKYRAQMRAEAKKGNKVSKENSKEDKVKKEKSVKDPKSDKKLKKDKKKKKEVKEED